MKYKAVNNNNIMNGNNNFNQCVFYNNTNKNVKINFLLTHLFSCYIKCFKKNENISFLEKANEMFAEKLDIYNLFHIIINIPKNENKIDALRI